MLAHVWLTDSGGGTVAVAFDTAGVAVTVNAAAQGSTAQGGTRAEHVLGAAQQRGSPLTLHTRLVADARPAQLSHAFAWHDLQV